MGPYYRNTSQGLGNFFEIFYILLIIGAGAVGACLFI